MDQVSLQLHLKCLRISSPQLYIRRKLLSLQLFLTPERLTRWPKNDKHLAISRKCKSSQLFPQFYFKMHFSSLLHCFHFSLSLLVSQHLLTFSLQDWDVQGVEEAQARLSFLAQNKKLWSQQMYLDVGEEAIHLRDIKSQVRTDTHWSTGIVGCEWK